MGGATRAVGHASRAGHKTSFYKNGLVTTHYEEAGSGFPLLILPGGGLSSTLAGARTRPDFSPFDTFSSEYRCIAADLRNAPEGLSTGPLETDRPWDSYTDDQLRLMDHLKIDKFLVMGFCIGGPFIWNLLKRAPDRIVAAVMVNPNGVRPEAPYLGRQRGMNVWAPALRARRPELSMEAIDAFVGAMYDSRDFVYTVSRDFVRNCEKPILFLPDDIPEHPYEVAMEAALLAPRSEISIYPWQQPKERIPRAVRQIQSFFRAHLSRAAPKRCAAE
jgi:pimeloyl-ACP methyl ester carboxylesterase